jgi:hypothetical protein
VVEGEDHGRGSMPASACSSSNVVRASTGGLDARRFSRRVVDGATTESPACTERIANSSSAGGVSLSRKPLAPACSPAKAYSSRSNVVSIRTRGRSPAAQIRLVASTLPGPVRPGADRDRRAAPVVGDPHLQPLAGVPQAHRGRHAGAGVLADVGQGFLHEPAPACRIAEQPRQQHRAAEQRYLGAG